MDKDTESDMVIDELEKCSRSLNEINLQTQALYDVIKIVKDSEDRKRLAYVYKQMYEALGKHMKSFGDVIRVVKDQMDDEYTPEKED